MSSDHHTPIPYHSARTTAVLNAPLGELDAAITAVSDAFASPSGTPSSGDVLIGDGTGASEWSPLSAFLDHDHSEATYGISLSPTGGLNLNSIITPSALAANTNDWNPNGGDDAFLWRISASGASRNLTGIAAPAVDGATHMLTVIGTSTDIVLIHNSSSSSGANRIFTATTLDMRLTLGDRVLIVYDATEAKWLVQGVSAVPRFKGFAIALEIGPTALSASVNDWNPAGLDQAGLISVTQSGAGNWSITGIVGQETGRRIMIFNNASGKTLTLVSQSGSSSAGNRFLCPNNVDLVMPQYGLREIVYAAAQGAWLVLGSVA